MCHLLTRGVARRASGSQCRRQLVKKLDLLDVRVAVGPASGGELVDELTTAPS
jgi:hypothetical protein